MNNLFTTIFNNDRTPKWVKILLKIILLLAILLIGAFFIYSSLNRKDYFGLTLAVIYNIIILAIIFFMLKKK